HRTYPAGVRSLTAIAERRKLGDVDLPLTGFVTGVRDPTPVGRNVGFVGFEIGMEDAFRLTTGRGDPKYVFAVKVDGENGAVRQPLLRIQGGLRRDHDLLGSTACRFSQDDRFTAL